VRALLNRLKGLSRKLPPWVLQGLFLAAMLAFGIGGRVLYGRWLSKARDPWATAPAENPAVRVAFILAFVAAGFGAYLFIKMRRRRASAAAGASSASPEDEEEGPEDPLAELSERDPAFSPEAFLARARSAHLKVQEGLGRQDMGGARAFLTDGLHQRFAVQFAIQRGVGLMVRLAAREILEAKVHRLDTGEDFDALHVLFRTRGETSAGGGPGGAAESREVWTFLRRTDAKTLQKAGLLEGQCPECGQPASTLDASRCEGCGAWVGSGQKDWALARITPAASWTPRTSAGRVPGLSIAKAVDPALSAEPVEDFATIAFWRWQRALWETAPGALARVASSAAQAEVEKEIRASPAFYRGVEIGGVEVLALEPGEATDRAHVLVKWSGERYESHGGQWESKGPAVWQHVFILECSSEARTDRRWALEGLRCRACGTPDFDPDSSKCPKCAKGLTDPASGWILVQVLPVNQWKPPALREALAAPEGEPPEWAGALSPADALGVMVLAMLADGEAHEKERSILDGFARKNGVPQDKVEELIQAAQAGQLEVPLPHSADQAQGLMKGLIHMFLADGHLAGEEVEVLEEFGQSVGLSTDQVRAMVKEEFLAGTPR